MRCGVSRLLHLLMVESLIECSSPGHVLYPAAIALSRFLELHSATLLRADPKTGRKGKNVVELGAGGGLPGLVAGLEGARVVSPAWSEHDHESLLMR